MERLVMKLGLLRRNVRDWDYCMKVSRYKDLLDIEEEILVLLLNTMSGILAGEEYS